MDLGVLFYRYVAGRRRRYRLNIEAHLFRGRHAQIRTVDHADHRIEHLTRCLAARRNRMDQRCAVNRHRIDLTCITSSMKVLTRYIKRRCLGYA